MPWSAGCAGSGQAAGTQWTRVATVSLSGPWDEWPGTVADPAGVDVALLCLAQDLAMR